MSLIIDSKVNWVWGVRKIIGFVWPYAQLSKILFAGLVLFSLGVFQQLGALAQGLQDEANEDLKNGGIIGGPRLFELKQGLTLHDVIKAWGPPQGVREKEALREIVWSYGNRQLFFNDGRLVAWLSLGDDSEGTTHAKSGSAPGTTIGEEPKSKKSVPKRERLDDSTIQNILTEILTGVNESASREGTSDESISAEPTPRILDSPVRFIDPRELAHGPRD